MKHILLSIPFPLSWRNLMPSGLAAGLARECGATVSVVSPYEQPSFSDTLGNAFPNFTVPGRLPYAKPSGSGDAKPAKGVASGMPTPLAVRRFDKLLKLIHQIGFAIEFPDGSIDLQRLSRERHPAWYAAKLLSLASPRGSALRRGLRNAYAAYRPRRADIARVFEQTRPDCLVVTSPGHYWLDFLLMDEARRAGIPTACIVQSWDNLHSRGPLHRRPDLLLVWSQEMRRQAIEVHQYPADRIQVVGPLQFSLYAQPPDLAETSAARTRIGLRPDEPFLYYVCGARTSTYDVEDVTELIRQLQGSRFQHLRVVVRPHPQGSRQAYASLLDHGVLLDASPDITTDATRPDTFDLGEVRHVAALLKEARFVCSSWGTTVLLEACIFNTPTIQLRWFDSLPHSRPDEVAMVRDFQRYYHMRAFDETGSRAFSDQPGDLVQRLEDLLANDPLHAQRRAAALKLLTAEPLGDAVGRVASSVKKLLPAVAAGPQPRLADQPGCI